MLRNAILTVRVELVSGGICLGFVAEGSPGGPRGVPCKGCVAGKSLGWRKGSSTIPHSIPDLQGRQQGSSVSTLAA